MEKTHCSNCGIHKDNYNWIHNWFPCYGGKHYTGLSYSESLEKFPREVYMCRGKLHCTKTRKLITSQKELMTQI